MGPLEKCSPLMLGAGKFKYLYKTVSSVWELAALSADLCYSFFP